MSTDFIIEPGRECTCKPSFLIKSDNKVVGTICLKKLNYAITEIKHLVIKEEYRKRGIGQKLMEYVMDVIETPLMLATVRADNLSCIKLNIKLGFKTNKVFISPGTGNKIILFIGSKDGL